LCSAAVVARDVTSLLLLFLLVVEVVVAFEEEVALVLFDFGLSIMIAIIDNGMQNGDCNVFYIYISSISITAPLDDGQLSRYSNAL